MVRQIQTVYNRYQQKGFVGALVRPNAPYEYDNGLAGVTVSPGQGVWYDASNNDFRLPTSAAERLLVVGIVSYDPGTVQSNLASVPSGSNSDTDIEFAADANIKIGVRGSFFVVAGEALEYGDQLVYNQTTERWVAAPALTADATSLPKASIVCIERAAVADGDIIEVRHNGVVR